LDVCSLVGVLCIHKIRCRAAGPYWLLVSQVTNVSGPPKMWAYPGSDPLVFHATETIRVPHNQDGAVSSNRSFLAVRRAYPPEKCDHLSLATTCTVGKCQSSTGTDIAWASCARDTSEGSKKYRHCGGRRIHRHKTTRDVRRSYYHSFPSGASTTTR
jgi:hypothetical protein